MHGTWKTTGGTVTITAGGVLAAVAAGYVLTHQKQATAAATGAVTITAITAGVVVVVAVAIAAGAVCRRLGGRGTDRHAARQSPVLLRANPRASPLPGRRPQPAIAPAPVVNVNIDAGLLAGLLAAAQQAQPAPVIVPSEREELPR